MVEAHIDLSSPSRFGLFEKLDLIIDTYKKRIFAEEIEVLENIGADELKQHLQTYLENTINTQNKNLTTSINSESNNKESSLEIPTFCLILTKKVIYPLNIGLMILGIFSIILGIGLNPYYQITGHGISIIVIVFLNIIVSSLLEAFKEGKTKLIEKKSESLNLITVERNEKLLTLSPNDLLIGDKYLLNSENFIPTDGIVLESESLLIKETNQSSALTKSKKNYEECSKIKSEFLSFKENHPDDNQEAWIIPSPVALAGSLVVQGSGWILAFSRAKTGNNQRAVKTSQAIEENIDKIMKRLAIGGFILSFLTFIIVVMRVLTIDSVHLAYFLRIFVISFSLIIIVILCGSSNVISTYLLNTPNKFFLNSWILKKICIWNDLARLDSVCTDLSVLTTDSIQPQKLVFLSGTKILEKVEIEDLNHCFSQYSGFFDFLIECLSVLRSDSKNDSENKKMTYADLVLMKLLEKICNDPDEIAARRRFSENCRFSDKNTCAVAVQTPEAVRLYALTTFGPTIKACSTFLNLHLKPCKLKSDKLEELTETFKEFSEGGCKTFILAYKDYTGECQENILCNWTENPFKDLTIIALIGVSQKIGPRVKKIFKLLEKSGIEFKILEEIDNVHDGDRVRELDMKAFQDVNSIALNITTQIITQPLNGGIKLEEKESDFPILEEKSSKVENYQNIPEHIEKISVVSKSVLEEKLKIYSDLQQSGHKVGVFIMSNEDLANLDKVEVSFALPFFSSHLAVQTADLILTDNKFGSIVKPTIWARGMFENIQKYIQYQLTVVIVVAVTYSITTIAIIQPILTPVQLLWVSFIMNIQASIALATEVPTKEILMRSLGKSLVTNVMIKHVLGQAGLQIMLLLIFVFKGEEMFLEFHDDSQLVCRNQDDPDFVCSGRYFKLNGNSDYWKVLQDMGPSRHFTYIFNIFVLFQLFNQVNSRITHDLIWTFTGIHNSLIFIVLWIMSLVGQIIIVQVGFWAFNVCKYGLTVEQWFICIAWGCVVLFWRLFLVFTPDSKYFSNKVNSE